MVCTSLSAFGNFLRLRCHYPVKLGIFREAVYKRQHHISIEDKPLARFGVGNVFPSFEKFKWGYTLPNYGIGLRWEFKKRINIRVDYGFGKHTSGFLFNINEAF